MRSLSIVIPCFNEQPTIDATLERLQPLRHRGVEIILVDSGSRDRPLNAARLAFDRVVVAPRGRASQMNAGAQVGLTGWVRNLRDGTVEATF